MPVTVKKNQLEEYLRGFLKIYRSQIKKDYPAYFNEFPFYKPLRVIGVITPNKVYVIFTRDGDPKKTSFEVYDETDISELTRVKDAIITKEDEICALLGIKTYIWDLPSENDDYLSRKHGDAGFFDGLAASRVATNSIRFHYEYIFDRKGDVVRVTQLGRDEYKPTIESKYSFVYNTIDERSLRTKVMEIFDGAEEGEEILITGWVGSFAIPLLESMNKRNVKFRIITHRPTPPEKRKTASDEYEIFAKILTKKYPDNTRILGKLHARLLISEKEALVSTADLTKDSHEGKFEAGISTTDGLTIKKLSEFFEKMWDAAEQIKS